MVVRQDAPGVPEFIQLRGHQSDLIPAFLLDVAVDGVLPPTEMGCCEGFFEQCELILVQFEGLLLLRGHE